MLVEEPTYPGVLELASLRGQRVIGLPADADGLRVDALEMACAAHRPRLLYLVPTFNNPTGRSLSAERRAALLRVANRHGLTVLEDDTYGFLGFERRAPPPLKCEDLEERVIYILSFSKMLAPALRLGVLVAPAPLLPALAAAKQSADLVCSVLLQRALARYLRQGHLAPHLHRVRSLYRQRRDVMLEVLGRSLGGCGWSLPEGGVSLQLTLPPGVGEREFSREAMDAGVGITPGAAFYATPQQVASLRLSFGGEPAERIRQGVATLGQVLEDHLRRRSEMLSRPPGAASPLV
jgi:DNA-binding transcriptional MocR family regulator